MEENTIFAPNPQLQGAKRESALDNARRTAGLNQERSQAQMQEQQAMGAAAQARTQQQVIESAIGLAPQQQQQQQQGLGSATPPAVSGQDQAIEELIVNVTAPLQKGEEPSNIIAQMVQGGVPEELALTAVKTAVQRLQQPTA